ncbi:conjugal transfer protein TraO [Siphonobacter sp. SORGH_AS_1065]|uniref:conjugal transfer protein TraO n=1 Tax=Siphonobacter sp. SORGH_AS_1065 TaxID=3041795 RepID=UPI002784F3F9|nr:conjugal transfer protein TraO [Siphonobacter sp. SORGH_AS_1065]MDQ1090471.1 hypothetical protein [Siphonobacter sp. SORGH_AS_1065]
MKYWFLATLVMLGVTSQAQIHNRQQRFVEIGGGFVDGLSIQKTNNQGYSFQFHLGKFGKKEGIWQFGATGQRMYYPINVDAISILSTVDNYLLEGSFLPVLFKTNDRTFYLHALLGAFVGYERVQDAGKRVGDVTVVSKSAFVFGSIPGLQAELNLSRRIAITGKVQGYYMTEMSTVQNFHVRAGIGLRYNYFKSR